MNVIIPKRFCVYGELSAALTSLGCRVRDFDDAAGLEAMLGDEVADLVLDINFHEDIQRVCAAAGIAYTVWSFDSAVSEVLKFVPDLKLRDNDRLFLFNRDDAVTAARYHQHVSYLPFSAGEMFVRPPLRRGFKYDLAFVMNSYHGSCLNSAAGFQKQLAACNSELERKILELTNALAESAVDECLDVLDRDSLPEAFDRQIAACGVELFKDRPDSRRRFCRGYAQLLSSRQRIRALRSLGDAGLRIDLFGDSCWREFIGAYDNIHYHGAATYDSLPLLFNTSKINVNLTQVQNLGSVPQRVFHLLAAGAFVLTNSSPVLEELFTSGLHLETFSSYGELAEKARYYLEHERARIKIAERGHDEFMAAHRMESRLRIILNGNQN